MRFGDIVEWQGQRWLVRGLDRDMRTAALTNHIGAQSVPDDLDRVQPEACQVICNPPKEWPVVSMTPRLKYGRLLSIDRLGPGLVMTTVLAHLYEWMVPDPGQIGGGVFFNPSLGLRFGDQLLATYERGKSRIEIPRTFLSPVQKIARAAIPAPPKRISVYDRLRTNPYAADDDDE